MNKLKYLFFILLLSSCLGIEQKIRLNPGGSGVIEYKYTLEEAFGSWIEEYSGQLKLPINKEDFERSIMASDGLNLTAYESRREEGALIITAEVQFDSFEALNALEGYEEKVLSFNGKKHTLQIGLPPLSTNPGEDSIKMIEAYFSGYNLSYEIVVPGEIISSNEGQVENLKKITFKIPINDILKLTEEKVWTLVWINGGDS